MSQKAKQKPITIETGALIAVVLGAVAIGFAPIFVRLSDVDPTATAFWRVALSLPFFMLWAARKKDGRDQEKLKNLKNYKWLLLGGFLFALDLALWHWSLQFTSVANASLFANLAPIVVAIGSVYFFREKLKGNFWLGFLLAFSGAALLAGGGIGEGRLFGDTLALITALFYGFYLLSVVWLRKFFKTATVMLWTGVFSALFLLPISLTTETLFIPETLDAWLVVLGLAFICQFLGQGLIAFALAHLPAAFGAITLLLQPVVATIAAWYLFGEILGGYDFLAGAAILTGIVLAKFGTEKKRA
ncbi:MAG: DMT family transporter [Alphaproteobacteria bacterium]